MSEPLIMFTDEEKDLIYRTKGNGASRDDFDLFLHIAQRCGLDPRANQVYLVKRQGKGTIQVGIDGLRLVADRTGKYAGSDDAEMIGQNLDGRYPGAAKVTVYKMVEGQRCPFSATARWDEYYPGDQSGMQWRRMPNVMLAKVAEALALRKAFPADLSGLYTNEEMDQAGGSDAPAATVPKAPVASPVATPEATVDATGGTPEPSTNAFGYVPAQMPAPASFNEARSDKQTGKGHAVWKDRGLDESMYGATRKAVLSCFGFDAHDKKGHMMLWIDFLLKATPEQIADAIQAAHEEAGQGALL